MRSIIAKQTTTSRVSGVSMGGANPAMAPHGSWQWSFAPPVGGRKNNDSIVKLAKCKNFAPPLIDVGYGFAPPKDKGRLKHEKGRWLKNAKKKSFVQQILICRNRSCIRQKFAPPRFWSSGSASVQSCKSIQLRTIDSLDFYYYHEKSLCFIF